MRIPRRASYHPRAATTLGNSQAWGLLYPGGMKPIALFVAAAAFAPTLALAQPVSVGCTVDPSNPDLAALCTDVNGAAAAVPDPCGDSPMNLSEALDAAGNTPERAMLVKSVLGVVARETGREMSPAEIEAAIQDPRVLEGMMTVSIPQVVEGLKKAQAAAAANPDAPPPAAPDFKLPSGVDMANAGSYFDGAAEPPKAVSGGLFRGDKPSDLPPEQVKAHRALGEVLNRLADNTGKPYADRFKVKYRGETYSTQKAFLDALERNGHTVTATVSQGIANFLDLFVAKDGQLCEVEAAVRVRTGQLGPDGREVVVPAVHSGLKIRVSGPDVNGAVSFFQGVGGTGFFAEGLSKDQSWSGGRDIETFAGADARRAIAAAGLWRKVVNDTATESGLLGGGYGQTGICNDSVALLQQLVTGRTTIYPLAMDKDLMVKALDAKIAAGGSLAARWKEIRAAVLSLPRDTEADPTQPGRILDSIPFGDTTPFPGADHARAVLGPQG